MLTVKTSPNGRREKHYQLISTTMDVFDRLKAFRQAMYDNLCRAHDTTFELTDAVILTRKAYFLADLPLFIMCSFMTHRFSSRN